jgi:leader peptidase (prepilin peptidase)/N-methyltransferase
VSFIWLGGKCRSCGRKIALRYPAIEIVTAIGFVGLFGLLADCRGGTICFWQDSYPTLGATLLFILLAITICIFVIDLEKRIIPDELIFAGFLLIVVPLALGTNGDLFRHLFGAFSAALFLLALHLLTKGKGMGLGDVKYGLLAGLFLGWPLSLLWLYLAFLTGAATAIILILAGKAKRRDKIAFGPFLALAFAITAVWGLEISRWLLP